MFSFLLNFNLNILSVFWHKTLLNFGHLVSLVVFSCYGHLRSLLMNVNTLRLKFSIWMSEDVFYSHSAPWVLVKVRCHSRYAAVLTWWLVSWSWTLCYPAASRGALALSQTAESPAQECDSGIHKGKDTRTKNINNIMWNHTVMSATQSG